MGAYTSVEQCLEHYGVTINCSVVYAPDNQTVISVGGNRPGEFNPDPDIAGIGVRFPRVDGPFSLYSSYVDTS